MPILHTLSLALPAIPALTLPLRPLLSPLSPQKATVIKAKPRIEANRVLVTGGAGFVGSHLCTYLVERGDHVRVCQRDGEGWGRGRGGAATQRARGAHGRCDPLSSLHPPPLSTPSPHAPLSLSHHAAPQVICVDNFFTGSKENIAHLIDKVRREREKERGRGLSALSLGDHLHLSLSSLPHALPPPVPFPPSPTSRSSATTSSRRSSSKSTRSTTWPAPPRPSTTSTTPLRPSKPLSWAP